MTTGAAARCCSRVKASIRSRVPASSLTSLLVVGPGVGARAADDDLVLLDGHHDRAVARPVLGVHRVVGDGGVQPEAVALLAVVERRLERTTRAGLRARAAAATAAPPATGLLLGLV